MSFDKNHKGKECLLKKVRDKHIAEQSVVDIEEITKNTYVLSSREQENIEKSTYLTAEENNRFVQHLLEEGKIRCKVKLAKPIEINK